MILTEPYLRKRSDGSRPFQNNLLKNPIDVFKDYGNSCIHYGEKNGKYTVIKLLLCNVPIKDAVDYEEVVDSLTNVYPYKEYLDEFIYYSLHDMNFEILIINDNVDWKTEKNNVLSIKFELLKYRKTAFIKSIKVLSQKAYQLELVEKFGINRTLKPLIYSTSNFEGYLSDVSVVGTKRTDITLFPGDVDLITFDENYQTINIFEFKKHTKYGYGIIEDQSFRKYLFKDRKKYYGLARLTKKLNKDYFFNVIYSTRYGEERKVKIEKINTQLYLLQSKMVNYYNYNQILEAIDEMVKTSR